MRSVADDLRRESRTDLAARSAAERVRLALALGDADVALLAQYQGLSDADARNLVRRTRQTTRRGQAGDSVPR